MADTSSGSIGAWRWGMFWCGLAVLVTVTIVAFVQPGRDSVSISPSWLTIKGLFLPIEEHLHDRVDSTGAEPPAIFGTPDGSTLWLRREGHVFVGTHDLNDWAWSENSRHGKRAPLLELQIGDDDYLMEPQRDRPTDQRLVPFSPNAMAFASNGLRGVAVGGTGYSIQATTDGGASWTLAAGASGPATDAAPASFVSRRLTDVALSDLGDRGIAVGTLGMVMVLRDDGAWSPDLLDESFYWMRSVAVSGNGERVAIVAQTSHPRATADSAVLWSENGGASWKTTKVAGQTLRAVSMSKSGDVVVAIGNQGPRGGLLVSRGPLPDKPAEVGWNTATRFIENRNVVLRDVAVSATGAFSIVVGSTTINDNSGSSPSGLVLRRAGADGPWETVAGSDLPPLTSVFLSSDPIADGGLIAVAVSQGGRIVQSTDQGQTWTDATLTYRRAPGPWYLVAVLVLVVALAGVGYTIVFNPKREGAAEALESDAAVRRLEDDRLDARPLAEGIANFILNPATTPSLTIAVTGRWGSGKSSVMGMSVDRLKDEGLRPVEFNAWHYQSEESLLAALLEAIKRQGIPPIWHTVGLVFRCRLFWQRIQRDLLSSYALALAAAILVLFFTYLSWDLVFDRQGPDVTDLRAILSEALLGLGPAAALLFIYRRTAFARIDAAKMVAAIGRRASIRDIRDKLSVRHRFAEEFADMTWALRGMSPLVLVIDDLDRCKPSHVVEVLETINFLTTAGQCFVVFGLDLAPVLAAVRIEFKRISKELKEADDQGLDDSLLRDDPNRYARQYLEKLINVQAPVSKLRAEQIEGLLRGPNQDKVHKRENNRYWTVILDRGLVLLKDTVLVLFPITAVAAAAFGVGIYCAYLYKEAPHYAREVGGLAQEIKSLVVLEKPRVTSLEECEQTPTLEGCPAIDPEKPEAVEPDQTATKLPQVTTAKSQAGQPGDGSPEAPSPAEGPQELIPPDKQQPKPVVDEKPIQFLLAQAEALLSTPVTQPALVEDPAHPVATKTVAAEDAEPTFVPRPVFKIQDQGVGARLKATKMVWFAVPFVAVLVSVLGFFATRIVRDTRPEDSEDVKRTLARWGGALRAIAPTARAVKQYQNQIRFMAMRQQAYRDSGAAAVDLPDSMLVALGALKRQSDILVDPDGFNGFFDSAKGYLVDPKRLTDSGVPVDAVKAIRQAAEEQSIAAASTDGPKSWPPTGEQLRLFKDLAADYLSFRSPQKGPAPQ